MPRPEPYALRSPCLILSSRPLAETTFDRQREFFLDGKYSWNPLAARLTVGGPTGQVAAACFPGMSFLALKTEFLAATIAEQVLESAGVRGVPFNLTSPTPVCLSH
ncbi:hypothetical protein M513_13435 [Trichuris suis]|uniref:Uncharacterized protein n=1 Tax=Trichuris suis TaxID=68888 RepID=A0A085LL49_9BILA|nr:hypothetical protein M513_13435 [Trichuris suis]